MMGIVYGMQTESLREKGWAPEIGFHFKSRRQPRVLRVWWAGIGMASRFKQGTSVALEGISQGPKRMREVAG